MAALTHHRHDHPAGGCDQIEHLSPAWRHSPSPPLFQLDALDLVSQPRGGLVVLRRHGALELVPQLNQRRLLLVFFGARLGTLPECRVSP